MNKRKFGVFVVYFIILSAGVMMAYGQQVTAKIPFEFRVEKKTLPAGTYTITFAKPDSKALTLRNLSTGAVVQVPIITRLAAKDQPGHEPHLVFDKVDEEHSLAELWLAGQDGFYLGGALTTHSHVTVKAAR